MLSLLLAFPTAALQQDLHAQFLGDPTRDSGVNAVSFSAYLAGWEIAPSGRRRAMLFELDRARNLGSLAGLDSEATSLVGDGRVVVGWSNRILVGGEHRRPFIWNEEEGMSEVPMHSFWGRSAWATDLDLFGTGIVGTARRFDGLLQAWEYVDGVDLEIRSLGTIGTWSSEALTVNDGFVGGLMREPSGREHAIVWDRFRNPWFVNTPGQGDARVTDVAINGQITGWFVNGQGNTRAYIGDGHDPTRPVSILPTLGGSWARAFAFDGGSLILGESETAQGEVHAFAFDRHTGEMTDLNDRLRLPAGTQLTSASSISLRLLALGAETPDGPRAVLAREFTFDVSGITAGRPTFLSFGGGVPNSELYVLAATQTGSTPVPGCPGLEVQLHAPMIVDQKQSDRRGSSVHSIDTPASLQGQTIYVQGLMPEGCLTTQVRALTYL